MRITVVGAAGMVGSRVVAEAAGRGHEVVAVFRPGRAGTVPGGAAAVEGDADDAARMAEVFRGSDAVVAATRPARGREGTVTGTTTALLDAAGTAGVRILVVGGAGPLRVPDGSGRLALDSPEYVPVRWRPSAVASAAQLEACRAHRADWVYLSPAAVLEPGRRTGRYRRGTDTLLVAPDGTSRISAEDFAVAVVDELENAGTDRHLSVGY